MRKQQIHATQFMNMRDVFVPALNELAVPHLAIQLPDWPIFNRLVGGFRSKEFSILCGPTGCGKTTFLANLSAQLINADIQHFVMSVETGYLDFQKRVISVWAGEDLNTGDPIPKPKLKAISLEHQEKVNRGKLDLALYENRLSVEQVIHDLRHMHHVHGTQVAFIDNLNFLLQVTSEKNSIIEMDRVIHELIIFCKSVEMHVVMVAHPKKTDGGRVISEFDIKGSSTAVQEAQNVFLFNRPHQLEIDSGHRKKTDRIFTLQKMRRRGMHERKSIIFENNNTRYKEKGFY